MLWQIRRQSISLLSGKMKKGITAIIAIILLLMMTVAAGALAYTWLNNVQREAQSSIESQLGKELTKMGTSLKIIGGRPDANNYIVLTVKNVGRNTIPAIADAATTTVMINNVYNSSVNFAGSACNTALDPSAACELTLGNIPFPGISETKSITVILGDGSTVGYSCIYKTSGGNKYC